MSHGEMWKNDDSQPPSSRGSIVSFGNSELATINEKEQKSDNQVSLIGEIETIESPAITRIKKSRFPSNNSLSTMCKGARRERSASMPFIQKALPDLNSETTKIFLETITITVSGLYCKLIVVLGICFPVAEVFSDQIPHSNYEGFYLYLYSASLLYLGFVYSTLLKQRAVDTVLHTRPAVTRNSQDGRYGSFYLRIGAIVFGIGSMIHCALEFGRYFEMKDHPDCRSVLMVLAPSIRITFIIIQLQFIFMNNKYKTLNSYKNISKFGLMHMIATNLSVWSNVVVHETKREIITHYEQNSTNFPESLLVDSDNSSFNNICTKSYIMGSLVTNATPFLFPCTIEYSLISSVILYALWKNICNSREEVHQTSAYVNKVTKTVIGSSQHFNFANARKGLFGGIIVLVFIIISLIMFYTLIQHKEYFNTAVFQVNLCELILYVLGILASILAIFRIRRLKYESRKTTELDTGLLVAAQTGLYVYFSFSLIVGYFTKEIFSMPNLFITSMFGIAQSTLQTLFITDAWWRRCATVSSAKEKPARQLVTFLLLLNIAMWAINHLENSRADFHPAEREFYGVCAWTIITQLSMPLAVFYRFHSIVCLCEIWKCTYKVHLQ